MRQTGIPLLNKLSVLVGALVVSLTACAAGGSPTSAAQSPDASPSPTPTGPVVAPAGYVAVLRSEATDLAKTKVPDRQNVIMGPSFRHQIEAVGVVSAISADQARANGLPRPVEPAEGHEFVVTTFSGSTTYTVPTVKGATAPGGAPGHRQEPDEAVVVDGHAQRITTPVGDGEALVVSVPTGHHPFLRLSQAGVTQSVDLRTGQRVTDALTPYYPYVTMSYGSFPDYWDGTVPVVRVRASLSEVEATMSTFSPAGTWAAKGKAWVYVVLQASSVCSTNAPDCRVTMTKRDIALVLPNGKKVYPTAGDSSMTSRGLSDVAPDAPQGIGTFGYEVPATLRSATLAVNFGHKVALVKDSKTVTLTMGTPPGPARIKLNL